MERKPYKDVITYFVKRLDSILDTVHPDDRQMLFDDSGKIKLMLLGGYVLNAFKDVYNLQIDASRYTGDIDFYSPNTHELGIIGKSLNDSDFILPAGSPGMSFNLPDLNMKAELFDWIDGMDYSNFTTRLDDGMKNKFVDSGYSSKNVNIVVPDPTTFFINKMLSYKKNLDSKARVKDVTDSYALIVGLYSRIQKSGKKEQRDLKRHLNGIEKAISEYGFYDLLKVLDEGKNIINFYFPEKNIGRQVTLTRYA